MFLMCFLSFATIITSSYGNLYSKYGFKKISVNPYYFEHLEYAKGRCETDAGTINVFWQKTGEQVRLEIDIPSGMIAFHGDKLLSEGRSVFVENASVSCL